MFELKESDLPELERLEREGYPWIARDANGSLFGYRSKPTKKPVVHEWYGMTFHRILNEDAMFVPWSDPEPLNIAAAIEQIKAREKPQCPYCSTDAFERVGIYGKDGFNPYHTYGAGAIGDIPKSEHFIFCPMCGRPLNHIEPKAEAADD